VLYKEDCSTASAHLYSAKDLLSLAKAGSDPSQGQPPVASKATLDPRSSIHRSISNSQDVTTLHSFHVVNTWREDTEELSCLSLSFEIDEKSRRQCKTVHHHYFSLSAGNPTLNRTFRHRLQPDEHIRVNERGVELFIIGIHGRHAAWLLDRKKGSVLQVATFSLDSNSSSGSDVQTLNLPDDEVDKVDSLELEDAQGVLFITTPSRLIRYDFN
jgi:hypothetical protein